MILVYIFTILAAILLGGIAFLLYIRFSSSPPKTEYQDIPKDIGDIVVMAPAFLNLGKYPETGKYNPGLANMCIAQKLESFVGRFKLVMTQKAVSDALKNGGKLPNGTPVRQMHLDNSCKVGTLEAFQCAAEWLEESSYPLGSKIGLMAHDKHLLRSHQALEAVLRSTFPGIQIVDIHLGKTPYQDDAWYRPWQWAAWEAVKWPVQSLQILWGQVFGFKCSQCVKIPVKDPEK